MNISKKWVYDSDEVDDSKATKLSNYQCFQFVDKEYNGGIFGIV